MCTEREKALMALNLAFQDFAMAEKALREELSDFYARQEIIEIRSWRSNAQAAHVAAEERFNEACKAEFGDWIKGIHLEL